MTAITSWRPFRSFVRRDGLFGNFGREFVPLPEMEGDPAGSATEDAANDEATSAASTSPCAERIHSGRKS
jgi:hypothetical protein